VNIREATRTLTCAFLYSEVDFTRSEIVGDGGPTQRVCYHPLEAGLNRADSIQTFHENDLQPSIGVFRNKNWSRV
jgi:hypothetical protein